MHNSKGMADVCRDGGCLLEALDLAVRAESTVRALFLRFAMCFVFHMSQFSTFGSSVCSAGLCLALRRMDLDHPPGLALVEMHAQAPQILLHHLEGYLVGSVASDAPLS